MIASERGRGAMDGCVATDLERKWENLEAPSCAKVPGRDMSTLEVDLIRSG